MNNLFRKKFSVFFFLIISSLSSVAQVSDAAAMDLKLKKIRLSVPLYRCEQAFELMYVSGNQASIDNVKRCVSDRARLDDLYIDAIKFVRENSSDKAEDLLKNHYNISMKIINMEVLSMPYDVNYRFKNGGAQRDLDKNKEQLDALVRESNSTWDSFVLEFKIGRK